MATLTVMDGIAGIIGIDNGGDGQVIAENKDSIVVKWPGHKYWVGHNMDWEYAPVRTQVFAKVSEKTHGLLRRIAVEPIIDWQNRKKVA